MRSVIEPGFWLDRMRILPDDFIVDQLFDDAYQVERGVDLDDSDALQAWRGPRLNDPVAGTRPALACPLPAPPTANPACSSWCTTSWATAAP